MGHLCLGPLLWVGQSVSNVLATPTKRSVFTEQFLPWDRWFPLFSSRGERKVMFVSLLSPDLHISRKLKDSKNSRWFYIIYKLLSASSNTTCGNNKNLMQISKIQHVEVLLSFYLSYSQEESGFAEISNHTNHPTIMGWFDPTLAVINSDETGPLISMSEAGDYEEGRCRRTAKDSFMNKSMVPCSSHLSSSWLSAQTT